MHHILIEYLFMVLVILGLVLFANKIKIAYPIILVIGGLILSFTEQFSHIGINPEIVFLIFLPPLLYEAAWQTSWKEFWKWRRVITSFAFPIVIITSTIIAFFSSAYIPGFTLALGFLLGGIISPPDAVSATTIMRQVNAPKSLVSIIEGESLLNDASSLIVFRFALAAVLTGQFDFKEATLSFFLVIIMGVFIGLLIGLLIYLLHRFLPLTPSIETVLTLITPYAMYYAAEHYHFSGVLAVVSGGLLLSSKRQEMLNYQSRIQGVNVWGNLVFVFNGFIFLLIGLQLPVITDDLGTINLSSAIAWGIAISAVLILTRLGSSFGAAAFTRFISRFITVADANPGWKMPLIAGWAGMRGVVSLAAALSIPVMLPNGAPFPLRNLVLFITFVVILITLVFQGLTLPWLIRKINVSDKYNNLAEAEQNLLIQKKLAIVCKEHLRTRYERDSLHNPYVSNLLAKLETDLLHFENPANASQQPESNALLGFHRIQLDLLTVQRNYLAHINRKDEFDEEIIRNYFSLLDLEEYRIRESQLTLLR
ncbi:Na+/H+ antiporter [Flavihumibacter sp. CACIAM 22H1]|uniref:Na+/H+ antiporter n=1 Tax=Flavihumibacter sp. CACIAM 22H1 TaxID=1812911 RepID=UPI0007A892CE|nr:Na+/H+ antiporter [Flavihumibacter sp. CACIAM 22H1]KYP16281.1 MAG: Na+/H+ antiporter [Flavihumibacter sp. CACIAM 22H1]